MLWKKTTSTFASMRDSLRKSLTIAISIELVAEKEITFLCTCKPTAMDLVIDFDCYVMYCTCTCKLFQRLTFIFCDNEYPNGPIGSPATFHL